MSLCSNCYLLIKSGNVSCSRCHNSFHIECEDIENGLCFDCAYLSDYSSRLKALQKGTTCRFCQQSSQTFCDECLRSKRNVFTVKDKKRNTVEELKLKQAKPSEQSVKLFHETLTSALESGKLVLYSNNKCSCLLNDCDCLSAKHCLFTVQLSNNDYEIIKNATVPPVYVTSHPVMGYIVVASENIHKGTYICEYLGDAFKEVEVPDNVTDSKFLLLDAGTNRKNIVINPSVKGANVGKFIAGYSDLSKTNVETRMKVYDNNMHIIMFARKDIMKGQILYYYYGPNYDMSDHIYQEYA